MARIDHEPSNSLEHKVHRCQLVSVVLAQLDKLDPVDYRILSSESELFRAKKESTDLKQII